MTRKLPKYVQGWVDREGRPHHYFRRPGYPRVPLPGLPWSDEFMAAHAKALADAPTPIGIKRSKPGSVAAAIAAYLDSTMHFGSLAANTQRNRRPILERFREQYGDMPISSMPQKFVAAILAKKKPHAAHHWLKTLHSLCVFAIEREWLREDPTRGIKLPPPKSAGYHTWTDDEIERFAAHHAVGTKARLALALLLYTVQRRSDVVRMGRQHIRNGTLHVAQEKTGAIVELPVRRELQVVLDATPNSHLTFLVTQSGQPYRPHDFSEQFRAWCDAAGLPKRCVAHGLRKAGCRRLAEAGCSANEIAAWSGHRTLREVERYTRAADQRRMARNALAKENAGRTGIVKPAARSVKAR
jgi:integrase